MWLATWAPRRFPWSSARATSRVFSHSTRNAASNPSPAPVIQPMPSQTSFAIIEGSSLATYRSFEAFAEDLAARKDDGALLRAIRASGVYAAAANTVQAWTVVAVVE